MLHRRPYVTFAVLFAACSPGLGTGPTGDFTLTTTLPAAATLGTVDSFQVTLHSTGGYAGNVILNFSGVPAGWVVTVSQDTVTLVGGGSPTAMVYLTIPTNGTPAPSGQTVTVHAIGAATHTAPVIVTVANELVVPIVLGADSAKHFGAFTIGAIHLNVGTMVSVLNNDSVGHIVHYNGGIGLAHQAIGPGTLPGQKYSQTVSTTGSDLLYCHSHATADTVHFAVP